MTIKQIKLLAVKSFTRNELDPKKTKFFSAKMKRKDLRNYIREIKAIDDKNKVTIVVPEMKNLNKSNISVLLKHYKGKKIIYSEDPNLLVGIKVIDNDLIYDFNLKNSLESVLETYD